MTDFDDRHKAEILKRLSGDVDKDVLHSILLLLAHHRVKLLQNTIVRLHGTIVQAGPFAGMVFAKESTEGCFIPKLLGCYEAELHPFIEQMVQNPYDTIINIGSAEGYYATGFKRLCPSTRVIARDTDPAAQAATLDMAVRNQLGLDVGGEVHHADFAHLVQGRTLVWCDIEGGEKHLLDPEHAPELRSVDLVVECHGWGPHKILPLMIARFEATHELEVLHQQGHAPQLPPFLQELDHLDQLLAQWEFRSIPTPWLIAKAKI